jgi:hypothetical protein
MTPNDATSPQLSSEDSCRTCQNLLWNLHWFASLMGRVWDKQLPVVTWGWLACNDRAVLLASGHLEPTAWAMLAGLVGSRIATPIT